MAKLDQTPAVQSILFHTTTVPRAVYLQNNSQVLVVFLATNSVREETDVVGSDSGDCHASGQKCVVANDRLDLTHEARKRVPVHN